MIQFIGGAIVGAWGAKVLKSGITRDVVVHGLAKGILFKDAVLEQAANMRDGASDICAEAKVKAQEKVIYTSDCACGSDCDCGSDCACETDCGTDCGCGSEPVKEG